MAEEWRPPDPPDANAEMVTALDARVDTAHLVGALPCPSNPAPPLDWEYWSGPIPKGGEQFASDILKDPMKFPMGTFVQGYLDGTLVGARVEWHSLQGATGKQGCFRGVNLMRALP